ncbi:hypothetical protein GCM10007908_03230 [Rhizobium albus]|nr:hypothetical protein GCM10007908_03230 [Rhizobium albus]
MSDHDKLKALVDRIDGKADRMAAVDRLRTYVADPETFENLNVDDAEEINGLLLEASRGIDALLSRLDSAEKALKLAYDDFEDSRTLGYDFDVATEEAFAAVRAHLSQYGVNEHE